MHGYKYSEMALPVVAACQCIVYCIYFAKICFFLMQPENVFLPRHELLLLLVLQPAGLTRWSVIAILDFLFNGGQEKVVCNKTFLFSV